MPVTTGFKWILEDAHRYQQLGTATLTRINKTEDSGGYGYTASEAKQNYSITPFHVDIVTEKDIKRYKMGDYREGDAVLIALPEYNVGGKIVSIQQFDDFTYNQKTYEVLAKLDDVRFDISAGDNNRAVVFHIRLRTNS